MGMKFLNKKGWHTGSLQNLEKVWKAEQKHAQEQTKLEELRKQYQDEKKIQEFRQLQEEAGIVVRQERVDFLYDSGLATGKGTDEDYLLGKPMEEPTTESEISKLSTIPGSLLSADATKPASANEQWRKIHSDPLFLIRQQEQEALARIRSNPVKMELLRKQAKMKELLQKEEEKKAAKKFRKEEKREKKEKRREQRKLKSRSEKSPELSDSSEGEHRGRQMANSKRDERKTRTNEAMDRKERENSGKHGSKGDSIRGNENWTRKSDYEFKSKREESEYSRDSKSSRDYDRRVSEREHQRSHGSQSEGNGRDRVGFGSRDSRERGRSDGREDGEGRRSHGGRESGQRDPKDRRDGGSHGFDGREVKSEPVSEGEGKEGERKWGLSGAESKPHLKAELSEPDKKKPKLEESPGPQKPPMSAGRPPRHRPGKLTAEERAARLAEMMRNADSHEEDRWQRLKRADVREKKEASRDDAAKEAGSNFLEDAEKAVFGTGSGGIQDIGESLKRRSFYSDRGSLEGKAFTRK